jgi:hypothetical protein
MLMMVIRRTITHGVTAFPLKRKSHPLIARDAKKMSGVG